MPRRGPPLLRRVVSAELLANTSLALDASGSLPTTPPLRTPMPAVAAVPLRCALLLAVVVLVAMAVVAVARAVLAPAALAGGPTAMLLEGVFATATNVPAVASGTLITRPTFSLPLV